MSSVVPSRFLSIFLPSSRHIAANLERDARSNKALGQGAQQPLEAADAGSQVTQKGYAASLCEAFETLDLAGSSPWASRKDVKLPLVAALPLYSAPRTPLYFEPQTASASPSRGIADVSVHLPYDSSPREPHCLKVKLLKNYYPDGLLQCIQWATLFDACGQEFVTGNTVLRGSSGKIRWAIRPESPQPGRFYGEILAVKELRHVPSRCTRRSTGKTALTPRRTAEHEIVATLRLRRAIDAHCRPYVQLPISDDNSLRRARDHEMPFKLHAVFGNKARTYFVMNKDLVSTNNLFPEIPETVVPFALTSLWAQLLTELHGLHAAEYLHGDVSAGNVNCTVTGQYKLMDFGRAATMASMHQRSRPIVGTYVAPEMIMPKWLGSSVPKHGATEVFAAGILLASVASKTWHKHNSDAKINAKNGHDNIFLHSYRMVKNASFTESFVDQFGAFACWFEQMRHPQTGYICAELILGRAQVDLFSRFFAPLAAYHPHLCEMVLNEALPIHPEDRIAVDLLAQRARGLLPRDEQQKHEFIAVLQNLDRRGRPEEFYRQAMMYYNVQQSWAVI